MSQYIKMDNIVFKREAYVLPSSFIDPYGGHPDHSLSLAKCNQGGRPTGGSGCCLSPWDCQCGHPAHPRHSHLSSYPIDIWTLPARHQWVDAVVGGSSSKGILRQWLLGSSLWLHLNQHRELDTVPAFTLLS
jgi:hypothetical protein